MSPTGFDAFERAVHRANTWLNDLAAELGRDGDRAYAYRVLRSYLHLVRDRVLSDQAVDFAAQLPLLLRGVFYDGWNPARTPQTYREAEAFLDRLAAAARLAGPTEASFAAEGITRVLRRHMSPGQVDNLLAVLPEGIRQVLEPQAPTIDLTSMVADAVGESVALDDLPGELRSRVMAATGNARLRVIAKRRGSDGSAATDAYEVYALGGDRFVHMVLALRPDGSVEETTETLLADEIHAVEIEPGRAAIRDASDRVLAVPGSVAVATATLIASPGRSAGSTA